MREELETVVNELKEETLNLAKKWGHLYIGAEHLLLAITSKKETTACSILKQYGITQETVEKEIDSIVGRGTTTYLTSADFNIEIYYIFKFIKGICKDMDKDTLIQYVLIMLLLCESDTIDQILHHLGVDYDEICDDCLSSKFNKSKKKKKTKIYRINHIIK